MALRSCSGESSIARLADERRTAGIRSSLRAVHQLLRAMHCLSVHTLFVLSVLSEAVPAEPQTEDSEFHVDQSRWVDPGDMGKFDFSAPSLLTRDAASQTTEQCSCPTDQKFLAPDVDCSKTKEKLATCKKDLAILSKILTKSDGNPKTDAFFRRLSIILTNKLAELYEELTARNDLSIHFVINQKFVDRVRDLQRKGVNETTPVASIVDEVSDILIPLIQKAYLREEDSFWVRNFDHLVVAGGAVIFLILFLLLLQRKVFVVMTISFVISVLWEWRRLYEEEMIKKEVSLMSGPAECGQSWGKFLLNGLSSIFFASSSSDPCHKYYSSIGVKTILKCNPMLAVQNVAGILSGGSFALLASYSGQATKNFFSHIPFMWYPFVGAAVLLLLIFAMTFSFGYDVRVPFLSLQRNQTPDRLLWHRNEIAYSPVVKAVAAEPCGDVRLRQKVVASISQPEDCRRRKVHKLATVHRTQSLDRFPNNR